MRKSRSKAVDRLLAQQAALAEFGRYAFRTDNLHDILTEATRVTADCLGVPCCKVCRYRPEKGDLLIEAGVGWKPGIVGHASQKADHTSPAGRAFVAGRPMVEPDLREAHGYVLPPFYGEHGIISTVNVPIRGAGEPYGVLEIDSPEPQRYDENDINFLTGFANVVAEAVDTAGRVAKLRALVEEQQASLEVKATLTRELQHRVRNNLQLVYGMLNTEAKRTTDEAARKGIRDIGLRVLTLAQVYDHLLGNGMSRTVDFGEYLRSLCTKLAALQQHGGVELVHQTEHVPLDLDAVTALGIAVTELVTNAYEHAFPRGGGGKIEVVLLRSGLGRATLLVRDNGAGLHAPVDAVSKRNGLGLVRRLVRQAKGVLDVDAESGTVWRIKVPVAI
jgi:two-component sensor histidine kinase